MCPSHGNHPSCEGTLTNTERYTQTMTHLLHVLRQFELQEVVLVVTSHSTLFLSAVLSSSSYDNLLQGKPNKGAMPIIDEASSVSSQSRKTSNDGT